ncbi:MAG TPA: class I SAM-dependent methyltransferase [Methylovirgula sp.]|nr:class I SAM-dependent methyltransferase [Methylovirgula sp.]
MSVTTQQIIAGQAAYTKQALRMYDLLVLGASNRMIWKCPSSRILAHFNKHITSNHLDVGVGTGYFLDFCTFPSLSPRVALMDLNPNTIEFASHRIARYKPETYIRNVLEPISIDAQKFDSISTNYLLHCLPGTIASKSIVFDHLKDLMNPGAVLFGSTLLQGDVRRSWPARGLMEFYNSKGIFSNEADDASGLRQELCRRFDSVSLEVIGCAALFSARIPL